MRKIYLFILILIGLHKSVYAQLITTIPAFPAQNDSVVITFDATQGNGGLKGYTGNDVYAYTGVITDSSAGQWAYVKESSWLDNPTSCKLTRIATDKYKLTIAPSIRQFYGVPANINILKMAFVFRNSTGTISGRDVGGADILVNVYLSGLKVNFIKPSINLTLAEENQKIPIEVTAAENDSICLFLDNVKIKSAIGNSLIDSVYATGNNIHSLISVAYKDSNSVADTVNYMVHGITPFATLPAGLHDGINYINDSSITFVLFAPYKKFIYLLGDFNYWLPNNSKNLMFCDSSRNDSDRFWVTVNHLIPGKEYIFQYLIDGNIRIADPYVEKISDPDNDKFISSTIYPNLVAYPTGKTTGIAGVVQTAQTSYSWQDTSFIPPPKNKLVIYELLIRDFTANKDIKSVTDSINYFKRLGINAIELMPFSEFDGNDSWGYNPCFYFVPDKAYGTKDDYKKFVDVCHQNGIAVIQDMVLDFSTNNSPLVQMYFANGNPSPQNPWYDVTSPNTAYIFGNVFNHNSPYTRKLTDSITSFWMKEYKIDGFRFDFAKGWTNTVGDGSAFDQPRITNLELAANHIWKVNPNAYAILELFTANTEETILANYGMMIWGNMNNNYCQAAMSYNDAVGSWDLSGMSYKYLGWKNPGLIGYMESHDEERVAYKCETYGNSKDSYNIKSIPTACERVQLNNLFFLTIPGPKMIWQFGELGYDYSINYCPDGTINTNCRTSDKPVKWDYYDDFNRRNIFNMIRTLNLLKQKEPVFSSISNFNLNVSSAVKAISLDSANDKVMILGNFDINNQTTTISFPENGVWYEFFTNDTINITGGSRSISLNPGEYKMYSTKKLNSTNYVIADIPNCCENVDFNVYPNPFNNVIQIPFVSRAKSASIYSISGRIIKTFNTLTSTLNTSDLQPGVYILNVELNNGDRKIIKLVKV